MTTHFVGFRGDEYHRAQRVFGPPDFVHHVWDACAVSMAQECPGTVIFAKGDDTYIVPYTRDDSRYF